MKDIIQKDNKQKVQELDLSEVDYVAGGTAFPPTGPNGRPLPREPWEPILFFKG